jgi:hypothetical protein
LRFFAETQILPQQTPLLCYNSQTISKGVHFEINAILPPLDSLSRMPYPCMKKERISFPCTQPKPWTGLS